MRKVIFIILYISHYAIIAQPFIGDWYGNVQNANGSLPAEMHLKSTPGNTIIGELIVMANGANDTYLLKASANKNSATGMLTYKDGTVFNFTMQLTGARVRQEISYNGQVILHAEFSGQKSSGNTTDAVKPDGLYRDPNLVGKWSIQENYSSGGGYYGGSSSVVILNADGTIDDGGSESYISGPNSSGRSEGGGNKMIAEARAAGARWYTKGNIFYWRLVIDGKMTDVANSRYYIEKGALLLTDLKTGKKQLYYKK